MKFNWTRALSITFMIIVVAAVLGGWLFFCMWMWPDPYPVGALVFGGGIFLLLFICVGLE